MLSAYLFHVAMAVFLGPPFIALRGALWLLFSPYEVVLLLRRGSRSDVASIPASADRRPKIIHVGLLVGATGLQWFPTAIRDDHLYPFFNYAMFNGFYRKGDVIPSGSAMWVIRGEQKARFDASRIGISSRDLTEQLYIRGMSDHPRHRRLRRALPNYCASILDRVRKQDQTIRAISLEVVVVVVGSGASHEKEVARCTVPSQGNHANH